MKNQSPHSARYVDTKLKPYIEVFEEMDDIIIIMNDDGTVEYINTALRKILGYKQKRFTGKNIADCFYHTAPIKKVEFLKKVFRKRDFTIHVRGSEGKEHHLSWKVKPFHHRKGKKLISVIRDTTLAVELQEKLRKYTHDLQEMVFERTRQLEKEKQKAVELHQAKGIFLSRLSHEMRTPLTAICGYVELLEDSDLDANEQKKYQEIIQRNARAVLSMVNDTLNMIQIEQDKYSIHEKSFEIRPLVEELIETYQPLAEKKNIRLELAINDNVPKRIYSDPAAVNLILTNLISNALKYTRQGSITIHVRQRVFHQQLTRKLYFYVKDTGIGIPKKYHQRVFNSFEQYLDNQDTHLRGSGLGLSISKQLAKLLGGKVKLQFSIPHKGSIFVFSLPYRNKKI